MPDHFQDQMQNRRTYFDGIFLAWDYLLPLNIVEIGTADISS